MVQRLAVVLALATACVGCSSNTPDRHSYDVGRSVSSAAAALAEESGDITESCRQAVRDRFSSELLFKDEPDGIDMDSAIAGCVDALK